MISLGIVLSVTAALLGVMLAVVGWRGTVPRPPSAKNISVRPESIGVMHVVAVLVGVLMWWWSGWPVAGVGAAAMVWMFPMFAQTATDRERAAQRSAAVASWVEMLSDLISSGAALRTAIVTSAPVAPDPIRVEVMRLRSRVDAMPLSTALRMFATDMHDANADLAVSALALSSERQGGRLPELLSSIAASTRSQVSSTSRIEASRAKTYASARTMIGIGVVSLFGLLLWRPAFINAFNGAVGQMVLVLVFGCFVGGVWALLQMSRPEPMPRVLEGIEI